MRGRLSETLVLAPTKLAAPCGVEFGAVAERHYALNWLTGFENRAWDDVTTPT